MPTVVLDAGNLFWKSPKIPDSDRAQRFIKAELQAEVYHLNGVDAMVPGPGDLALGLERWRGLVETYELPLVGANLSCSGLEIPASRVIERGGRRIGVVGVAGELEGCTVGEPLEAVRKALADLGSVDVVVLLSSATTTVDQQLAKELPAVDFVVSSGTNGLLAVNPRQLEGGAYQLGSGSRGKKLGVLELGWVDGASGWSSTAKANENEERLLEFRNRREEAAKDLDQAKDQASKDRVQRRIEYYDVEIARLEKILAETAAQSGGPANSFTHRLVDLEESVGEHPDTSARVAKAKEAITAAGSVPQPSAPVANGPLAGSEACRGCHLTEYAQWDTTGHAHAYNALESAQRHLDNDCYSCHVTGAGLPGGPTAANAVAPTLRNVGCESCHGPANEHARNPSLVKMSKGVSVEVCTTCHDGDRDGGRFNADQYIPKVLHQPAK